MKITIKKYEDMTGYKLEVDKLTTEERIKIETINRDSFLQKLHQVFQLYDYYLTKFNAKEINESQFNEAKNTIYEESGYEDIYDFYEDYIRWRNGLPINIKFRLV